MPDDPVRPAGFPAGRTISPRGAALALAAAFGGWILIPAFSERLLPPAAQILVVESLFVVVALAVAAPFPRSALALRAPTPAQAAWILLAGGALSVSLAEGGLLLQQWLPPSWQFQETLERESARYRAMHPALQAAMLVAAAAVGEEFLFRGVLARSWAAWLGPVGGLVASSAIFGLIHVVPVRIAVTFVLGLHFGLIVLRTGRLGGAILAHAANNAFAVWGDLGRERPHAGLLAGGAATYAVLLAIGWKLQGKRDVGTS